MRAWTAAMALIALAVARGDARAQAALQCGTTQKPMAVAQLVFGRKVGDRIAVTEMQWTRFLDREITPRFPDGLSVVDAQGQWRDRERNTIVREPSKIVTIVLMGKADDQAGLDAIIAAYKQRFKQQSVGLIVRPACVSF